MLRPTRSRIARPDPPERADPVLSDGAREAQHSAAVARRAGYIRFLCLIGLALGFAYRGVWTDRGALQIERALFSPESFPAQVVLALAAWLLWRRRSAFLHSPSGSAPATAILLMALGTTLFCYAILRPAEDLLLVSLALNGLGIAFWARGLAGCRIVALPLLILCLGTPVPKPIEDEIIWRLQLWTADGAASVLDAIGREFTHSGVILQNQEHTFHVIDSCSGWNGIGLLLVVSLIVRELFAQSGVRLWILPFASVALAIPLNIFRVAYIAASPNPEALAGIDGDHTTQGLLVVGAGTLLLYALGVALSSGSDSRPAASGGSDGPDLQGGPDSGVSTMRPGRRAMGAWAILLALISVALPLIWGGESAKTPHPWPFLSEQREGWQSEPAPKDLLFTGTFRSSLQRRYIRARRPPKAPEIVDVLIAYVLPEGPNQSRLFSSKRFVPGPEWSLSRLEQEPLWRLDGRQATLATSKRPSGELAVSYSWADRDDGLWIDSLREMLGIERGRAPDDAPRLLVRIVTYAPTESQYNADRAKQRLDRFVHSFRDELNAL